VFTAHDEPHVFGYCGDVVFPSLVLAQVTSAIDQCILFPEDADANAKHAAILHSVKTSFGRRHNTPDESFWILHAMRTSPWPTPAFAVWQVHYDAKAKAWEDHPLEIPSRTGIVGLLGTGRRAVKTQSDRWRNSYVGARSSSIFSAFCDALRSGGDPNSGGAPQIAALYTQHPPQVLGFIEGGAYYLHGLEVLPGKMLDRIEWRDGLFQRLNPATGRRMSGARRLVRPTGL
jgi:hypothetical protein